MCAKVQEHVYVCVLRRNQYVAEKHPSIELLLITLPGHGVNRHVPVQENAEACWRLSPHYVHTAFPATHPPVKALAKLAAEELLSLSEHFGPFALLGFSVGATASKSLSHGFPCTAKPFGKALKVYSRLCACTRDDLSWTEAVEVVCCWQGWAKGLLPASGTGGFVQGVGRNLHIELLHS